jgi:hypothetical protein
MQGHSFFRQGWVRVAVVYNTSTAAARTPWFAVAMLSRRQMDVVQDEQGVSVSLPSARKLPWFCQRKRSSKASPNCSSGTSCWYS